MTRAGSEGLADRIGRRLKRLRQDRNWSQAQLGRQIGVHQKQISGYERGVHVPSTDVLVRLAQVFGVSLDYLVFDDRDDAPAYVDIADRDLVSLLHALDQLAGDDKNIVRGVLHAFVLKSRFQRVAAG